MRLPQNRVFITGATGHSGRYAIERLAERRSECPDLIVRVLLRPASDASSITQYGLPLEIVRGDIQDDAILREALTDCHTLLNIYGIISDPARVAQLALQAGVKRIISVHTTGIYSRFKNARKNYLESDRKVTEICREHGVPLSILRPTMIYGGVDDQNVIQFIRMMDRFPIMPIVANAEFPLQPVHRQDLGHAYADVLLNPEATSGKSYVLSGKEPISLRQMLTEISDCLGKKARFLSFPFWFAYAGAWTVYLITLTRIDYRERVQRLVEPRAYSHQEATVDFGYQPRSFRDGVAPETADYLKMMRER